MWALKIGNFIRINFDFYKSREIKYFDHLCLTDFERVLY